MAKMAGPSTNNSTTVTSLNDLPDGVLLHIISFLPTSGDAIITSYISRKWRNLWLSTPSLNFHHSSLSNDLESVRRFASFVDKTLIRRPPNSPLHTLSVILNYNNGVHISQLNSWIRYAVSHDVENLHLRIRRFQKATQQNNHNDSFQFPFCVLRDSRVRALKLSGCDLSLPSENTQFASLRSVKLDGVRLTDQIVADLVVACVNLEILVLDSIQGCKEIKICCSKLKELTIEFMKLKEGSVEVVAPNLCALNINCCDVGNFVLRDASSLIEAYVNVWEYHYWVKFMSLLGHVKRLRCCSKMWFELVESKDVYSERFVLLNLKHVQLHTSYTKPDLLGISVLLALSPNLETMVLDNCYLTEMMSEGQMSESISEDFFKHLIFNARTLIHVKMKSFMGTECEKNLVIALLKTAVSLERIALIPAKDGRLTPQPQIVLDPQFKSLQDLEYIVSRIPRWRRSEEVAS